MSNITVTYRDGRVAQLEQVYIRGSKIRFLILPDMLKNAPMLKSMKNKNQGSGAGRGKAAILKAQGEERDQHRPGPLLCSPSGCRGNRAVERRKERGCWRSSPLVLMEEEDLDLDLPLALWPSGVRLLGSPSVSGSSSGGLQTDFLATFNLAFLLSLIG